MKRPWTGQVEKLNEQERPEFDPQEWNQTDKYQMIDKSSSDYWIFPSFYFLFQQFPYNSYFSWKMVSLK